MQAIPNIAARPFVISALGVNTPKLSERAPAMIGTMEAQTHKP